MNSSKTIAALNRLFVLHSRSLPLYLRDAGPWMREEDSPAGETLGHIIEDQLNTVERLGAMILDRNGVVEHGRFPMEFTGWHDLSFAFVLKQLIDLQRKLIRTIEGCVRDLAADPEAKAVAEEILGQAKAHLDSLVELTRQPAAA